MAEAVDSAAPAPAATDERVRRNRRLGFTIAAALMILDQAVKLFVTYILQLKQRGAEGIDLLPIFRLVWTENTGVSLGYLNAGSETERWLLVLLTGAISAFVVAWLWRERRRDDSIALAMVLGGALGNILDRIRLGYVVDYADLHFGDVHPFLVFNVGDAAITIGVLLLLVRALLTRERKSPLEEK